MSGASGIKATSRASVPKMKSWKYQYSERDALPEKIIGVIKACAKHRRGTAIVFGGPKDDNGIRPA